MHYFLWVGTFEWLNDKIPWSNEVHTFGILLNNASCIHKHTGSMLFLWLRLTEQW